TQINLSWTDNSVKETGYGIERSTNPTTGFTQVAVVRLNVTAYADTGLTINKTYYYRVRALNSNTNLSSGYSNTASARTLRK
ncbi:MAG TPA: fibronectin type III domain-containing protein, partial [Hymenobacter sp.]|nr:fibronectin type III domain-containing protein [Hymenobacter sp.]